MERSLLEILVTAIQRYHNKDFLKAAMAVCALVTDRVAVDAFVREWDLDRHNVGFEHPAASGCSLSFGFPRAVSAFLN